MCVSGACKFSKYLGLPPVLTRAGGSQYKLTGAGHLEVGTQPKYVTYVFVFLGSIVVCSLYKLTLSDQAQVTLQLRVGTGLFFGGTSIQDF